MMATLRNSASDLNRPFPVVVQSMASISALPRAEKRLMMVMRIWILAVWRSGFRDMTLSPKDFRQFILASPRFQTSYRA